MKPSAPGVSVTGRRGVTLIELLVVMAIIAMILAVSFPSVVAGLEGVRLQSSARGLAGFVNQAHSWVDRDQSPLELLIDPIANKVSALSADGQWERFYAPAQGVRVAAVLPRIPGPPQPRRFVLLPETPLPRFQVRLESQTGRALLVSVDPLNGSPQILEAGDAASQATAPAL